MNPETVFLIFGWVTTITMILVIIINLKTPKTSNKNINIVEKEVYKK